MIKYRLICKDCEIIFDSWFSLSKEYERLKKKNLISCHFCNSLNVEKTLMSPSLCRSKNRTKFDHLDSKYKVIKKTILDYQNFIKKNLNDVGANFAYEARSMYYKNKKSSKGIYGTASKEDLNELKEEGIQVESMSWVKNTTN